MFGKKSQPQDTPDPDKPAHGEPASEHVIDPDATAEIIDQLTAERDAAAAERDALHEKYVRALADHQNYHRRALHNEQEAKRQGAGSVLLSILPVLDHFDLALTHDTTAATVDSIVAGMRAIRAELIKSLSQHGVTVICPAKGDAFDPMLHQALMQQPAEDVPPGHIVSTFQAGYTLNDRTVRPASVAVTPAE